MAHRDYYEILNVARDADEKEIKRAYRRLAMDHHPDRNPSPDAEARFKEASEAYQVLSDPEKRRTYDRFGHDGLRNSGFSGFSGSGMEDIFSSFGDVFGDLFGFGSRSGRRGGAARGSDLRYELTLEFKEAVFGCKKDISIDQHVACETCHGSGAKPGTQPVRCNTCQGRGQVVHGQGMFLISATCPDCQGQGSKTAHPCSDCRGQGKKRSKRNLSIRIPEGFDDGMSLRYSGEGEPGEKGGPAGDLYIVAHVKPHKNLQRQEDDLILETKITMVQAALGDDIVIETLEGEETVSVPKGTQPNDVVTLRKKGVPKLRGNGRGDLHVVLRVEIPRSLNAKQKQLLEEFAEIEPKKRRLFS